MFDAPRHLIYPTFIPLNISTQTIEKNCICIVLRSSIRNDVDLNSRSINKIREGYGRSLLHLAILAEDIEIFDRLLAAPHINIEVEGGYRERPLHLAVRSTISHFALKLISKGADVHLQFREHLSLLHATVLVGNVETARGLIEAGVNIEARYCRKTALLLACEKKFVNMIKLLLDHGANPHAQFDGITSFYLALKLERIDIQQALFEPTFPEGTDAVDYSIVVRALITQSPFCSEIIRRVGRVEGCTKEYLDYLPRLVKSFKADHFKSFVDKFTSLVQEWVTTVDVLSTMIKSFADNDFCEANDDAYRLDQYFLRINTISRISMLNISHAERFANAAAEGFTEILLFLLDGPYSKDLVSRTRKEDTIIRWLCFAAWNQRMSVAEVTDLTKRLLSLGLSVSLMDVYAAYNLEGRGDLFELLLNEDVVDYFPGDTGWPRKSALCTLILDVNVGFRKFLEEPQRYGLDGLDELLDYSAHPELKKLCLKLCHDTLLKPRNTYDVTDKVIKKVARLPPVQSLVELARDVEREYLISSFGIKTHKDLYQVVNCLPIADVHRKILLYENKLY